jgi:hypothetical protein
MEVTPIHWKRISISGLAGLQNNISTSSEQEFQKGHDKRDKQSNATYVPTLLFGGVIKLNQMILLLTA